MNVLNIKEITERTRKKMIEEMAQNVDKNSTNSHCC